ncbi:hypothetical protein Syun_006890 [Stephania yunnanensis]|uniref:Uncharacterized protein n=1 Tax=Stephania yunnanensis TaxID=152371 RepID=A0AAP0KZ65_9MAGN
MGKAYFKPSGHKDEDQGARHGTLLNAQLDETSKGKDDEAGRKLHDIVYPNDPRFVIKMDDDLKQLFRGIKLPRDMIDIENDLQKNGMKPATNTAKRRAMAQVHDITPKTKPKKKQ